MKEYNYTVVFEPAEDGGFTVYVPALPGCVSEGDSIQEALAMIREAIELYLDSLRDEGRAIPNEGDSASSTPFLSQVAIAV